MGLAGLLAACGDKSKEASDNQMAVGNSGLPTAERSADGNVSTPSLQEAFEAAFGKRNSAVVKINTEYSENAEVQFKPARLVKTTFGPVLISIGRDLNEGQAQSGKVAVHYLTASSSGVTVKKAFVPFVETGTMGQIGEWSISKSLAEFPVIYVEGTGTWEGNTCTKADLVELRPEGPVSSKPIPVYYDDAGAVVSKYPKGVKGKMINVRKDQSFSINYTGDLNFVENYRKNGVRFERVGGETKMPTC